MALSRRREDRLLSDDERALVATTRGEALKALGHSELNDLIGRLRERRSRARSMSSQQRREMRGKSEATKSQPAARNDGTELKAQALASALKRANSEKTRRAQKDRQPAQAVIARKALKKKRAAEAREKPSRPPSRTKGRGMRKIESDKTRELTHPMEVGRVQKFVASAQAKRDARGG